MIPKWAGASGVCGGPFLSVEGGGPGVGEGRSQELLRLLSSE